ncbi:hypothetical protein GYMLUDRAFT_252377 [Collybiopsis luxurians FD-317 M1]|uniref:Uncharacterized protein n=1 Tax=Collybiopsis luxurians FD-317 M1 TaxID=944289 RepID=A0A0D0C8K5_9AGAR|nr:hypothetical protein GYMLUDRAFT_252377 [Collybiopsis luxurians FD-317 M1]
MLQKPVSKGGKNLISLEALRDAIGLMRMKVYLNYGKSHSIWTRFADDLARRAITKEGARRLPKEELRINLLLQNWDIVGNQLPAYLSELMKLSKKYGVQAEVQDPTKDLCRAMPAWDHFGSDPHKRQLNNVECSKCLQSNYEVKTIGDLEDMTKCIEQSNHKLTSNCDCQDCKVDRMYQCTKPVECADQAQKVLDTLLPKWNPKLKEETTPEEEQEPEEETSEAFKAPRKITQLKDSFRVFTNAQEYKSSPEAPTGLREEEPLEGNRDEQTTVYIGGSAMNSGSANAKSGGGVWHGENNE